MNRKLRSQDQADEMSPPVNPAMQQSNLPKHIELPNFSKSIFLSELFIFVFTTIASLTQFLHLYKSVWWPSHSYSNSTVHFYLIDPNLLIFIFVMISRRFAYLILSQVLILVPEKYLQTVEKIIKYTFFGVIDLIFIFCTVRIFQNQSILHIFTLLYPLIIYIFIFRFNIDPFLKTNFNQDNKYMGTEPMHNCFSNPIDVRNEVEMLKNDFNNRFKQIIFTSVLNSYYASFAPISFVNKHLYYSNDKFWIIQHFVFTWASIFTMCTLYCFPIKYCDVLHRSSIHLGKWIRLSPRASHPPPQNWSKTVIFPYGSYVKYSGDVYKSVGYCTSALPSDMGHYRFYALFKNPSVLYFIIAGIQIFLVVSQLILISYTTEYQYVISIGLLLITNYYTLFKLIRDYLVVRSIYKDSDHEKSKNS